MELSSRFAGMAAKPFEKELTWRQTMNFAAAVDDPNPYYFDDEREGGIIAPPMIAVRLSWYVASRWGEFWGFTDYPDEVMTRQVHYTEHLELHRPIIPGDTITTKATIACIQPHAAGTHMVVRFDGSNQKGEPVFTEYSGAMLRDVKCPDGSKGREDIPADVRMPGGLEPLWDKTYHVHPLAAHLYDGCADIHFPIHTSVRYAHSVGLPDIILHGTATLSHAIREVVNAEAGGDPTRLTALGCRFTGMVMLDSDIVIRALGRVDEGSESTIFFEVRNAEDQRVIRNGFAKIAREG